VTRNIRITPKDSKELAFLCEFFDRLGLEYSLDEGTPIGSNLVREPAEEYLTTAAQGQDSKERERLVAQALLAEEEIDQGRGLTPAQARAFMKEAFKA
jgi:hypothetical protein